MAAHLLFEIRNKLRTTVLLLPLTFLMHETLFMPGRVYGQTPLFRLMRDEITGQRDNNITVFLDLLKQTGQTNRPPTKVERSKASQLLNSQKLFNPQYQSVSKPSHTRGKEKMSTEQQQQKIPLKLTREHFKLRSGGGSGGNGGHHHSGRRLRKGAKRFRMFLEQLSHCPLSYQWKDLGSSVWPRYIKETYCVRKSCSYPDGMFCSSSDRAMVKVTLLYWTCHTLRPHSPRAQLPRVQPPRAARDPSAVTDSCEWKLMHVNAISQCTCTCGGRG